MFKFIRNMRGRDSQRGRLYKAERRAQRAFPHPGDDVSTPERYIAKVNAMMASEWMHANFPRATHPKGVRMPVEVKFRKGMGGAHAGYHGITSGLGPWTMNMLILCHELSHTIVRRQYGTSMYVDQDSGRLVRDAFGLRNHNVHFIAGHGPEYADVYLRLVREFIGYEQWKLLRAEFDASRIRYVAPEQYQHPRQQPALKLAYATRAQGTRNSNPSVKASVRVTGGHLQRPTVYPSMHTAFTMLQLPLTKLRKLRLELKADGKLSVLRPQDGVAFHFETIAKE